MAKRAAKRSTSKRERIDTGADTRYAKRTAGGQFREMDDVGRSQRADRRTRAARTVSPGFGDQGDQATGRGSTRKRTSTRGAAKSGGTRKRAGSATSAGARKGGAAKSAGARKSGAGKSSGARKGGRGIAKKR